MIDICKDCGAIVGKNIISLPHICKLSDKLRKSLNEVTTPHSPHE
jgi:hypothetical protein